MAPKSQRRSARPRRGKRLSRAAQARGGRLRGQLMAHRRRTTKARLSPHEGRRGTTAQRARRVGRPRSHRRSRTGGFMSGAETYLRELRRALPIGCRRRFVAEMREHFESAVAAEAARGVGREEAERLTIERLGPAHALADQLLADLRSGALGPAARLSAALTATHIALAAVLVIAVVA